MAFRIVCFFLLTFSSTCLLEAQGLPFQRIVLTKVGETPMEGMLSMAEDDQGFLWLGGISGLYKYDGTDLEVFSTRPNDTTSIVPGPYTQIQKSSHAEALWIGSSTSGLSYFDLRTERARNYVADLSNPNSLISNEITGLYEDTDGSLWVGTPKFTLHHLLKGSTKANFRRFEPEVPGGSAFDKTETGPLGEIVPDLRNPDILWIGSRFGVYRFDKKKSAFKLFPFENKVIFWYQPINLQLFMDASGILWCGSLSTGLCRLDPATGKWRVFKKESLGPAIILANTIQDITALDANHLLVMTREEDAWKVDWKKQTIEYLNIGVSKPSGGLYYYFCGQRVKSGDIWLTYQLGLIQLSTLGNNWGSEYFPALNPELDKNNWQRAFALSPDKQSLYIGTLRGNGLLAYHIKTRKIKVYTYTHPKRPEDSDVFMDALCFDDAGRCWIGSDTGLLYLDAGSDQIHRFFSPDPLLDSLQNAHIAALAWRDKVLWIGTKGRGLFRLDLRSKRIQRIHYGNLSATSVINCLLIDAQKRIWVGQELGLTVFNPESGKSWDFNQRAGPPRGLTCDLVTSLALDEKGHLWIATLGGGILRLRNADPERPWFDTYYNNEEPGGNLVYEFVLCDRGKLWLGVQSGLAVLDTTTRAFINYDRRDGMFAKIGAMIRLPDGRIASGDHRGFQLFHPDSIQHAAPQSAPYLKRFRVFDKDIKLPLQIDRMKKITLAHNQNHFSFELGAMNFGENARTKYAYRLEGYDHDWVQSGARSYVSYTNLPAGNFTLRVKAANKHGVWSEQEKIIQIFIQPPYWQTWWFRLTALIFLIALGYIIFLAWRQRRRILQAQDAVEYFANADYQHANIRDILWDVSHKCMARLGLEDCVIYLMDEEGQYLVQEAAYGSKGPELYHLKDPLRIAPGQGIVGSAALKGQAELVSDTRKDPRYLIDDVPRLSELAVPILHDGEVIGVIDSEHRSRGFFKEYHVQVLKTIASLCADKIVNARAEELMLEKERQLHELNRNLAESQLTALRAQMNPHFLFNCLNSINWYIIKNQPAEASRYIAKFSRLVRLILEHSKCRLIPLVQELEALRLYLDMEAMRFEQHFEYQIELSPGLDPDEALVPPLIFQPYIENAIWHGLMPKKEPGHLSIRLRQEARFIVCTIEDDGIGRAAASANNARQSRKRESQGLKITEARIRQHNQQENGHAPVQFTDLYDGEGLAAGTRVEVQVY